ncbi:MAG: NapC/NirT family cytochrome c [Actinobacteria bacterium]|nr:NapC/NirT family cytochrome c [Actinomycetota bacterium]
MQSSRLSYAFNWNRLVEIISQPREHPKELSLLVGMAILFIFTLIVLFALFFVHTSTEKKKKVGQSVRLRTPRELTWFLGLIGWLIVISFATSYVLVASPTFCLSCHGASRVAKDLKSSVHAGLACQDCHQTPGFVGSTAYRLEVGRMVIGQIMGRNASAAGSASRDACLSCHAEIAIKTIVAKSIRVKHKEPVEQGYRCERCHFKIAHNEPRRSVAMDTCYDCHGKGRALRCGACHVTRAGNTNYSLTDYSKATLSAKIECQRCHDAEKECLSCHKIAMPHSTEFARGGGHALRAGTDRQLCLYCHKIADCARCHSRMPGPHEQVKGWIKGHGPSSRLPQAGCSNPHCHPQTDCVACHTDLESFNIRGLPSR